MTTDHPSHPDMLMSRMLGVCWHSPTSDRWPCGPLRTMEPPADASRANTQTPCLYLTANTRGWDRCLLENKHEGPCEVRTDQCNDAASSYHGPCIELSGHIGPWHRDEDGTEWKSSEELADWEVELLRPCAACGCLMMSHGLDEGDTECSTDDCDCDAFEAREPGCGCDGDPIECNHEAALGEAEEKLRQVRAVCDELDARYLSGDGKPLTSERQAGRAAGYSLAAQLVRRALGDLR